MSEISIAEMRARMERAELRVARARRLADAWDAPPERYAGRLGRHMAARELRATLEED